ncbi:MAG: enoyl-CoA hydratase/isomerase family protein [Acidobacteriaceae bacterium]|nr:enoyl-CoA hydratase/isomerase family protein [Acidobacteriaceae bacterium]
MNTTGKHGRDEGRVTVSLDGTIAHVIFDRPSAYNALTWKMYDELAEACRVINDDLRARVAVFRGGGGRSFIAGTDIRQFQDFSSGEDGIAYENKMERIVEGVESLRVPTIVVVEGYAAGAGLAIACACDIRIAATGARFGVPVARTVGNCLAPGTLRRLVTALGQSWVQRMLLLAEMPTAEMVSPTGFLASVVPAEDLDTQIEETCAKLLSHAPITMSVTREMLRRLAINPSADASDLIRICYASDDFRAGVRAFGKKAVPQWQGR